MSVITRQEVLLMPLADIFKAIKEPATASQMQALMRDREVAVYVSRLMQERSQDQQAREAEVDNNLSRLNPPSTETLAAEAAVVAAEPDASVPAPAAPPVVEPAPERKKLVRQYQVRDEENNPIGRPTYLEAWTEAEMADKMQVAHENATRAFHRLKKQKLHFKEEEQKRILTPEDIKATATKALETKDATEAEKLVRGLLDTEFKQREIKLQQQRDFQEGVRIANEFVMGHLYDFNPVRSNMVALTDYLKEHGLDLTLDNLEVAFVDLNEQGDKLAPPVQTRTVEVAANPAPATATAPAPASGTPAAAVPVVAQTPVVAPAPGVSTPAPEATVSTPAAPNQHTAARRPGVNSSLPPGSLSAQRSVPVDPALARKDFMKKLNSLSAEEIRRKKNHDPQFVKELATYGIKVQ